VVTEEMILIPAGEFEMGQEIEVGLAHCQALYEPWPNLSGEKCHESEFEDEEPVHPVYLDAYYIDKYEVTNADYQVCVEEGICNPPTITGQKIIKDYYGNPEYADYPVVNINSYEALTFCNWRGGARLPTEAEWEKAARGTDGRTYPWGDEFDGSLGNFCDRGYEFDDGYELLAPVGSYPGGASPYGVMDLSGNVLEVVSDWYEVDYYSNSPYENPQGPGETANRVYKGGDFMCKGKYDVRAAMRTSWWPDWSGFYSGFRCAKSLTE
jgi:formylglycine-generating enzyme required for sulfatase activity